MGSMPSNDPIVQQLQLLLTAYGYNFYSTKNTTRSDDMLVRERASYYLAQAVDMLATLRGAYQQRYIPPLTRANPDPPQEALAQLREMEEIRQELSNIEANIRGMSVPTQDRIWWRLRNEQALLSQLLQFDLALVRSSEQVNRHVSQLNPEIWNIQGTTQIRSLIQQVIQIARDRERLLLIQL
jgi:hypothetical protein